MNGRLLEATSSQPLSTAGDLDVCAREPIQIPGAIQPHGVLLAVREPELVIVQASANTASLLGAPAEELLGRSLRDLFNGEARVQLEAALAQDVPAPVSLTWQGRAWLMVLHRWDGLLIAELERASEELENFARHHRQLQAAMTALAAARDLPALYTAAARAVSDLTGFERVMVYRFDADWHGEVVAEVLTAPVDSYLGLHFPASDIPAQARALYARTWLRLIPTATYAPVPIVPPQNPTTGRPLDLSYTALRSVSPIHLEYLRNMNVNASMSISLLVDGRLWGLIACHHREPRPLAFPVRAACELFGQVASREIAARQERRRLTELAEVKAVQTRFFDVISQEENFAEALQKYTPSLLEFMGAAGAAICLAGQCTLVGQTPPRAEMPALLTWLAAREEASPVFATDHLSALWPPAAEWMETVSGVLAVKVSRIDAHWVLWFRPEVVSTVHWAGNPEKPLDPALRIHPRKSFASWQQTVRGQSEPWREGEIQGAHELRLALNALVIRRTERLLKLNAELEQKNSDLNSFAYIASHDLKEPLRGIFHFSRFLLEDFGETLGEEGRRKLENISTMAAHTTELLAALGNFSRLGRMELKPRETDLQRLADEVLKAHAAALAERPVEILRPHPLPVVSCDPVLVREVFANLVANGLRYNDKPVRLLEISWREPIAVQGERGPVFWVRDNGIGIRERNLEAAFQMFRRLNTEEFREGTGVGLSIVKSIVERHGGRVWVESEFGVGSSFFFTLR